MEEKETEKLVEIPQIKPEEAPTAEKDPKPAEVETKAEDSILIPKVEPGKAKEEITPAPQEPVKRNYFAFLKDKKKMARVGVAFAAVVILFVIPLISVFVRSKALYKQT